MTRPHTSTYRPPAERICKNCKKSFKISAALADIGYGVYCSNACRYDPNSFAERFWERVRIDGDDDCWEWQSTKTAAGYGRMCRDGRDQYAHRLAWELTNGEIPDGLVICHRCDNPPCCNPAHLFLGDKAANSADMASKGRSTKGCKQWIAKLTDEEVLSIRTAYAAGGIMHSELAERYGVSNGTISRAVRGEQWAHVGGPITICFRKKSHR